MGMGRVIKERRVTPQKPKRPLAPPILAIHRALPHPIQGDLQTFHIEG